MTTTTNRPVRTLGIVGLVAGFLMLLVGGATWGVVSSQLSAQNITVSADAPFMAGTQVNNPLSAFAQAEVIEKHTMEITGGKTFADLDREDPLREVAQQGSFLRASLFTSVIAYGVAALVMGLGVLIGVNGYALTRVAAPATVREGATARASKPALATA
jgi:hypothetical protein